MLILITDGWGIFCVTTLRWMSLDLTDKSTLVQVMAWCRQATNHYLSQCWPRSLTPYGATRPQWVKLCMEHDSRNARFVKTLKLSINCNVYRGRTRFNETLTCTVEATVHHKTGSTMVHVMACCRTAILYVVLERQQLKSWAKNNGTLTKSCNILIFVYPISIAI